MQRSLVKIGILVLLAVMVLSLPIAAGCGKKAQPAPAPPPTAPAPTPAPAPAPVPAPPPAPKVEPPKEVKIGIMGGQTGPAAAAVSMMFEETEHIFRYINEVEGGIGGIKLKWKVIDNKGTPEGAVLSYKELKDGFNPLFYFLVEDYYYIGIKDTMVADKAVSFTSSAIDARCYVPPSVYYGISLPVSDGFAAYAKWVKSDWKGTGKPKIGVLYWDLPSGQQYRSAEGWVLKQGVELVPVQFPMALMDLKPQLMKLREAKVDYIWMMGVAPQAAVAVRDARALGIAGQVPFCFNEYTEPDVLLSLAGEAAEGFYSYRSESPYSDGAPVSDLYTKIWKWAANKEKKSDHRLPMTLKAVITALIKQAVADVGFEKLNRDALIGALNKLTSIDTMGNTKNVSFGPDRRIGITAIKMGKMTKTGRVSVGDWIDLPRAFEGIDK